MYYILVLLISAGLGCIPASIAMNKGYSFGLWWLYGWMLFIVAIIHVSLIPDKNAQHAPCSFTQSPASAAGQSTADELKKYKELMDIGVINEEEFQKKKEKLLET